MTIFAMLLDETLPGEQVIGAISILALGLAGLWKAWRQFRRYRSIRSVTPGDREGVEGLVRIRGRAQAGTLLISPLTATPCCFYRVEIDEDRTAFTIDSGPDSSASSSWHRIYQDEGASGFELADARSRMRVYPKGLNVEFDATMEREIQSKPKDARDEALIDYLKRKSPDPFRNFLWEKTTSLLLSPERAANPQIQERLKQRRARLERESPRETRERHFRFREYCVVPGQEYEIAGRIQSDESSERLLKKDLASGIFLITTESSSTLERKQLRMALSFAGWGAGLSLFGLLILIFR